MYFLRIDGSGDGDGDGCGSGKIRFQVMLTLQMLGAWKYTHEHTLLMCLLACVQCIQTYVYCVCTQQKIFIATFNDVIKYNQCHNLD